MQVTYAAPITAATIQAIFSVSASLEGRMGDVAAGSALLIIDANFTDFRHAGIGPDRRYTGRTL